MAESSASSRARRLLALLPFLREQRTVSLSELATAVGTDEATVAEDLTVLSMCGGDERDPGQLIGVCVDGDSAEVFADLPALDRPVRLSPAEARALTAALETIGLDPASPLVSRLSEFAERDADPNSVARTVRASFVQGGQAAVIAALDVAAERGLVATIGYVSGGTGLERERRVHPYAMQRIRDTWYLVAFCEASGEQRTFRMDRITSASLSPDHFERPDALAIDAPLPDLENLPRATIVFDEDAPDVNARDWPGAVFHRDADGAVTASVPYTDSTWLARSVAAQLGRARLVEPESMRHAVAREASRMLEDLATMSPDAE